MHTITRKYHFYAAHRNELLDDKCRNIHGHTYEMEIDFLFPALNEAGVGELFSLLDEGVAPIINLLDHSFIISAHDPLYRYIRLYEDETGDVLKKAVMHRPTSLENLTVELFDELRGRRLPVVALRLSETKSGFIEYRGRAKV